jgi:K+ transporter
MNDSHAHGPVTGKRLVGLTLGSLGVVYGDIGTSPIYAMREALGHKPHQLVTGTEPRVVHNFLGLDHHHHDQIFVLCYAR